MKDSLLRIFNSIKNEEHRKYLLMANDAGDMTSVNGTCYESRYYYPSPEDPCGHLFITYDDTVSWLIDIDINQYRNMINDGMAKLDVDDNNNNNNNNNNNCLPSSSSPSSSSSSSTLSSSLQSALVEFEPENKISVELYLQSVVSVKCSELLKSCTTRVIEQPPGKMPCKLFVKKVSDNTYDVRDTSDISDTFSTFGQYFPYIPSSYSDHFITFYTPLDRKYLVVKLSKSQYLDLVARGVIEILNINSHPEYYNEGHMIDYSEEENYYRRLKDSKDNMTPANFDDILNEPFCLIKNLTYEHDEHQGRKSSASNLTFSFVYFLDPSNRIFILG
jgi:hypothetical protein